MGDISKNCKVPGLFKYLKEKGISNKAFAEMLDVSTGNVSDWKSGRSSPNPLAIAKIAKFLEVDINEIYQQYGLPSIDMSLPVHSQLDKKEEATPEGQPLSPEKQLLLKKAGELSDDEIRKVLEYADFVKSQRKP